jgi:hypothetical protein
MGAGSRPAEQLLAQDTGQVIALLGATLLQDRNDEIERGGLIITERPEEYDGTTAVGRTEHLSADEVEFLRWRAERWMSCAICRPRSRRLRESQPSSAIMFAGT